MRFLIIVPVSASPCLLVFESELGSVPMFVLVSLSVSEPVSVSMSAPLFAPSRYEVLGYHFGRSSWFVGSL